jgi:hypothetical protein
MTSPWQSEGEWLRCQLHTHTTNSDGEPTPEGLVEHYARAGFDVLAITDHWHITPFEHEGILAIPSAELSGAIEGELEEADVLAYGIDELPQARERFPSIAEAASWIAAQGGVAYLGVDSVDVRCSPARSVALRSGRWDGCKVNADPLGMNWRGRVTQRNDAGAITAARFEPPEFHAWGRIEVEAADGGRAWSGVVLGRPGEGV